MFPFLSVFCYSITFDKIIGPTGYQTLSLLEQVSLSHFFIGRFSHQATHYGAAGVMAFALFLFASTYVWFSRYAIFVDFTMGY